jgi:hypothetical protein
MIARDANAGDSYQQGLSWLARQVDEWLLVLDNADDTSLNLGVWMPLSTKGNILITSRNQQCCIHSSPDRNAEIGRMNEEEAL